MSAIMRAYGKGYRETGDRIQPGSRLKSLCGKEFFKPIIIPGEPGDKKGRSFSGTEAHKAIVDFLLNLKEPAIVDFYSLQATEGLNAIKAVAKKVGDLIVGVNLIHPNTNPPYSISVMDWATSDLEVRLDEEKYLTENPEEIFKRLMGAAGKNAAEWRGDPIQFQKDLQRYYKEMESGEGFNYKVEALRDLGIPCNIYEGAGDVIVNQELELKSKRRAVMRHIPKEDTMNQVFTSFD